MNLNSLSATTWSLVSNSPLEILSSDPQNPAIIVQVHSDRIDLLNQAREVVNSLPCTLNLAAYTLSTSDDEQYLFINETGSSLMLSVKREADGFVVDYWGDGDEPLATTYEFYSSFIAEEDL